MKKYKFFALAFAAMTLGACSSEDVVDNGGQGSSVAPGEQGYVSLAINLPTQPGGTRIDEVYDGGTAAENDVKSAYLLLFSGASEDAATFQSAYELPTGVWNSQSGGNVASSTKVVQKITRPASGNLYAFVVLNGGGQDGAAIYYENGAPTIVIGIPVRYEHSPYCFSSYKDFKASVDLATAIIRDITQEKLDSFKKF